MDLTNAVRVARKALFDAGGIVINPRTHLMHVLPGAPDEAHERADAYNVLAAAHTEIGKIDADVHKAASIRAEQILNGLQR